MTALFGILGPASRGDLDAMAARLAHKGQHAHAWSPADGVWLGEVRNVPREHDEPDDIAYSGQLYVDWRTLSDARELGADGRDRYQRRIVTNAVERSGLDYPDLLDGHFAVAWWHRDRRELVLSTDRLNFEKIYYTETPERLVFASEYKALLALEDVVAVADPDALQYSIATFRPDFSGSLVKNIKRVRYGHHVVFRDPARHSHRYFNPKCRPVPGSLDAHARRLRETLVNQVEAMLGHHDRIALTLSGGLDSGGLLGIMRHAFPEKTIASYSIGTGESDPEISGARVAANHFGTEHRDFAFRPESLTTDLPKLVWLAEEFAAREEAVLQYQIESQVLQREKVLAAGHGADMVFLGMPRYRLVRMAEKLPLLRRGLLELYQQTQSGLTPSTLAGKLFGHLVYRGRNVLPPRIEGTAGPATVMEPQGIAEMFERRIGGFRPYLYHSAIYSLEPLEIAMPFLSRPVINRSLEIPTPLKLSFTKQKIVLREALKPFITDEMRARGKAIQRVERTTELSDVLESLATDLLSAQSIAERQLFDPAYVRHVCRRPGDGIYAGDQLSRLWMLISAEIWCRTFIDNRGSPYGFEDGDSLASPPIRLNGSVPRPN